MAYALLLSVFVIATCGLVYELIAGTIASYLLGDSVTQFSTVIGVYLFSMGIGSFLSRYFHRNLASVFIRIEVLIGLVGGFSAAILFASFEFIESFRLLLYALVCLTGLLVGLEIPILMRLLKSHFEFKDLVSQVFTFDYIGALIASLLFPMVLVPHLGLIRSAFLFGLLNVLVALWTLHLFRKTMPWAKTHQLSAMLALLALLAGFIYSDNILSFAEASTYPDKVIFAKSTPYQRLVITKAEHDLRLFLNGNLQFSSRDEYRYHEALVHVGLASIANPRHVLVLGGGDGLAVREILKYPSIQSVTLVDLDSEMTRLFSHQKMLQALNQDSLNSSKIHLITSDAYVWLRKNQQKFDFIVVDFPDPGNYSIGKLYSDTFYRALGKAIAPEGAIVIQSTSPYYAKKSFWCVVETLQSVGLVATPYHAYVPSFGDWGYVLATHRAFEPAASYPAGLKFITLPEVRNMLYFPEDMHVKHVGINKLNNQQLVRYFEQEWSEYGSVH